VGAAHEQPESTGRGTGADGADLQLSFLDANIPTEAQQIEKIDQAESEKTPSAFVLSQAEIENELRKHGSGFAGGKQRIMALYQTQPDRKLRAKALAKEYGIGGHSHDFLDGSRGFVNHDWKGLEFDHYPDHQKITLKWAQVEKYIDLMIQSDRYLTDKEKEQRTARQEAECQLPMLDGTVAAEYTALKKQYPNTLVGFELNGNYLFYDKDAVAVERILRTNLLSQENVLGKVKVTGFPSEQWAAESKKLWAAGNNVYLAGLNENGSHHQTKYLREADYLPIGSIIKLDGRDFRVEHVNFTFKSVSLQDMELTKNRLPIFRNEHLPHIRELYEEQQAAAIDLVPEKEVSYKIGDEVVVDLPTRTIEGTVGYIGDTDVRIDTSAHGQSWDNEVINKRQFEDGLRQVEAQLSDEELDELPISAVMDGKVQTFPDATALDEALNAEPAPEPAGNFRITDDHLGEGGAKQKYARNIEAIRTLFKLEQEHRGATAEEQQVLSQYVGWGGLSDAFDPSKDNWAKEYAELKNLLSEDEYTAARSSTLNAHYTSPVVIRSIYEAVEKMGFKSGNILEPSMGVGNFFGMLPDTMADSRLYGVELDSITGRIAKKLYPQADITVAGFETTDRQDFYDLAIGNVPFGQYKVNDKAYNKLGFNIHNYFFAKAIDQVRPGGVIAFVTSRYTMDSKDSTARKHMAECADLLGAIRLPNNAFKANAGTEVVSDIIFLQKRDRPIDHEPDWVQLGKTEDGFAINQYFVDHPEMVLGELTTESTPYGHDLTVAPIEGAVLADQLAEAVQHIEGQYVEVEVETPDVADAEVERKTLPADPDVKNFSYAVVDGEVYYRENSIMTQVELSDNAKARVTGMVELRQIVNQLIQEQLDDYPDEDIKATQAKLNTAYDAFTAKYGLLNDRKNGRLFEDDSSYYLLCSLENLDENKQLKSKADMFTKRTIRPEHTITSVDTPSEALAVSIGEHGRVDLPYMAELLGSPGDYERITTELQGVIFKDPSADADEPEAGWQTADEYLSGNVRNKLRMAQLAAESHPEFKINVEALTKAQPKDLEASEIDIRLGATWLNPAIVQQFMMETFQPPYRIRYNNLIQVRYSPFTSEWRIGNKSAAGMYDIMSTETYGTHRANAYKILEDTLNLRDCRIYDTIEEDGKERRVLNQKETMLAQQKQQAIKDTFAGWVWQDPQRRNLLVKQYNELFNSTRPREYDGSHIHFVGMNPEINLREHQRNAVAHVLYGGNTLLAHEVGAGKSFEMAASAMESKRLGLCQKSLFVVPNHLTEQWASEFLRLYPNAKLLVTSKKDFEPANRKRFCARIATGDYDAVIIGHSQFEKIPLSAERQARIIEDQIEEIEKAIAEAKEQSGEHFTVKQMEKTRKTLEVKLKKLQSTDRKDDVVTFEQLGVDRLFVDESQNYKNLYLYTKMRNVAGLSTSEAQKSSDMFGKCRYLDEVTGGRGVIFATGTPISNSMTEMYTLMRYLQYSTLQQKQLTHFDAWASTFGETTTAIELAPEGTGYRARTRFAKFFNLPELMNMFKEAADIKTSDQLHLPVPEAKFETVVVKPSEIQQDMVKSLSERAAEVHSGAVDPSVDNMLKITSDGRKIGLDQRLMNPLTPDDPDSKLNACVDNVLRIWNETKEDNLTQLIFCDMSTPKGDGSFNVYDDIRTKLLAAGVPESEVEFIHNADTEGKKADLFSKVRSGKVRVLLGSTAKMGAGTNVQTLLVAVHHLDVGWRPSDMTQRNGRIIRQGNKNKQVYVYNYVTEGTFDAYLWQTLENKQKFISQIMTSKSPMRSCDDVDEQALSYAEVKALCAGDPRIREKMDLDVQVAKLKVLRSDYQNQKYRLEDKLLKHYPEEIQKAKNRIAALKNDAQIADAHPQDKENFCGMTIKGMVFDEKKAAGERLMLACKEMPNADMMLLGTYRGFELNIRFDSFKNEHQAVLRAELSYPVSLGDDARGNITRLDNTIDNFADRIADAENALQNLEQQKQAAEVEVAKPFAQEEELAEKSARLSELNALLNIDRDRSSSQDAPEETEETETPATRPSVLAALGEKTNQPEPVKPFRSYYDKDGDAR
jgi:N12 class adenine-specific DNA methylase/adenine-specific DNA methylase